jgi:hypothetical protein
MVKILLVVVMPVEKWKKPLFWVETTPMCPKRYLDALQEWDQQ